MIIKDNTKYLRGSAFSVMDIMQNFGDFIITAENGSDFKFNVFNTGLDQWMLSCLELQIEKECLSAKTAEDAIYKATDIVAQRLILKQASLNSAANELAELLSNLNNVKQDVESERI